MNANRLIQISDILAKPREVERVERGINHRIAVEVEYNNTLLDYDSSCFVSSTKLRTTVQLVQFALHKIANRCINNYTRMVGRQSNSEQVNTSGLYPYLKQLVEYSNSKGKKI